MIVYDCIIYMSIHNMLLSYECVCVSSSFLHCLPAYLPPVLARPISSPTPQPSAPAAPSSPAERGRAGRSLRCRAWEPPRCCARNAAVARAEAVGCPGRWWSWDPTSTKLLWKKVNGDGSIWSMWMMISGFCLGCFLDEVSRGETCDMDEEWMCFWPFFGICLSFSWDNVGKVLRNGSNPKQLDYDMRYQSSTVLVNASGNDALGE